MQRRIFSKRKQTEKKSYLFPNLLNLTQKRNVAVGGFFKVGSRKNYFRKSKLKVNITDFALLCGSETWLRAVKS